MRHVDPDTPVEGLEHAFISSTTRPCARQDSSTQGLKATVINGKMEIVHTAAVNYDKDLPKVHTFEV